ncbi:MAG: DMT family transporter [Candidatus Lambdaproteobacteria bacterium]|nr:DMT family transporter [Candidatus Lambdaproteobacteria bacterium]
MAPRQPALHVGALHLAVLLFGAAGLFGRWVAAPALLIVLGRLGWAVAALALWRAVWRRAVAGRAVPGPAVPRISRRDRVLLLAGGATLALHWFAFFRAIELSGVTIGVLAYGAAPLFAALIEPPWFRERLRPEAFAWALLAGLGLALLALPGAGGAPGAPSAGSALPAASALGGVGWGILAGATFALLTVLDRDLARRHAALDIALAQDSLALACILPAALLRWEPLAPWQWGLLALLGVVCTAFAHGLYIRALQGVTGRVAALASALEPVYAAALAALLLGERPGPPVLAGGALIVAAVVGASLRARARGPRPAR